MRLRVRIEYTGRSEGKVARMSMLEAMDVQRTSMPSDYTCDYTKTLKRFDASCRHVFRCLRVSIQH